jgi:hypothetical protein
VINRVAINRVVINRVAIERVVIERVVMERVVIKCWRQPSGPPRGALWPRDPPALREAP